MAYWQVRAQLDKSYVKLFLEENRWCLLSEEHKKSNVFKEIINSIQIGEILYLVDENQNINYYGRCTVNTLNGVDIQVNQWIKLSSSIKALNSGAYIKTITNIKNNEKLDELLNSIPNKGIYKIKNLRVKNFRLIDDLEINFNQDLNVIIANNGAGKTTVLDAITIAFGEMLTKFPNVKGLTFKDTDLRIVNSKREPYMRVEIESTQNILWDRIQKRDGSRKTAKNIPNNYGLKELYDFVDSIIDKDNEDIPYQMPLIIYYGTNRAVFDSPLRKRNFKKSFSRFESLNGALKSDANFHRLFQWFDAMEDLERREIQRQEDFKFKLNELVAVREAIESMLPDFNNPRIKTSPLRFMIDRQEDNGSLKEFQIEQLSVGSRTVLAMVMDISSRMVEANPEKGNTSEAIIMIDELDLHLHPKWQQVILSDLRRTFPNAQFIVTTHSPHIISSIKKEHLFILKDGEVNRPSQNTYGKLIDELLLGLFELNEVRYPAIKNKIESLQKILLSENYNEENFVQKMEELEREIGKDDIALLRIRLEKVKRDKNAKN